MAQSKTPKIGSKIGSVSKKKNIKSERVARTTKNRLQNQRNAKKGAKTRGRTAGQAKR
jgi:hypothetical protein